MFLHLLLVTLAARAAASFANATVDDLPEHYLSLVQGNSLWTALLKNCPQPSMQCVRDNVYEYLRDTLDYPHDFQLTPFMKFTRNHVDYQEAANGTDPDEEGPRSAIEEVSRSLHGKSVKFLMTHDLELQLPETMFEGSSVRMSPRSLDDSGATVKFELLPKEETEMGEGRIFKKLKKFISEKLLYALLAILLVIKLLAAKFMFFMPMMVGAVTAKKLLVKVLLFIFPALKHFFKLCAYAPHGAKFHHHKHQISHVHHISHGHHKKKKHHHHHHPHDGVEIIHPHKDGPPILVEDGHHWNGPSLHHHALDFEPPDKDYYNPHEDILQYHSGGPALSHHFMLHRQDSVEDENEVQSWPQKKKPMTNRPLTPSEIEQMLAKAEKEAKLKARLQQERLKIQEENLRLQQQLRQAVKLQEKLKQQAAVVKSKIPQQQQQPAPAQPPIGHFLQTTAPSEPKHVYSAKKRQEVVEAVKREEVKVHQQNGFEQALHQAATITYDPFYSPILDKIDKILQGLGFNEEPCRERLICSMYKNPTKFSPHSNLLSAELSRDSKELQKPKTTNAAVIRFYRYVQAARDGQDKRECLRLYPACAVNTEQ